ncbi:NUDIX hydrolase [Streptomyces sp. NPDC006996]|uniref:NUDIX hydrolase n=1 Tax=Streptomyces sp. NPDC006996 TaxID=3156908 RepID=UPI0033E2F1A4
MTKIKAWREVSREQVFKKYSRVVDKVIFELPNSSEADFYVIAQPPAASVLALTEDNQVILVRQYRPGPKKILEELPGGFIDPDEDPLGTARREFREETGYDGEFEFIGTCLDDAYSTMERYCYVARNCVQVGEIQNTDTEQTEVVLLSLEEFRARLRSGRMTDVEVGYLGLDHLGLLK